MTTKPSYISRTGRVQSWMDDPNSRLPVSCTVYKVSNEMEGSEGIEASWRFVSHALRYGAGVAVHLSNLRAKGTENGKGLTASGPVSFGKIYSTLNEVIRRGGHYKNGACVLHLDLNHPDIQEFIEAPRNELPWVKRCVNITQEWWDESSPSTKTSLLQGIRQGDIWLVKVKYDHNNRRVRGNVCLEVFLPSRGTCLLQHVNLGACKPNDLPKAFNDGMSELCALHATTGVESSGEYLSPEVDRQVGLGMLGLANFLRREKITYKQFGDALEKLNKGGVGDSHAFYCATQVYLGIEQAAMVARAHKMDRAFAIAPTASCSYRSKDLDGFTCAPEIAPPVGRTVDRDSGTFGVETYEYGEVEIASEVGWDAYKKVADELMKMLDRTGLLHGYSFNSWSDVITYDEEFVAEWLSSPQTSLYYSLQVMGNTQDKSNVYAALDDGEVDTYLEELLNDVTCDCQE